MSAEELAEVEARLRQASLGELSSSAGSSTNSLKAAAAAAAGGRGGGGKHGSKAGGRRAQLHGHGGQADGGGWAADITESSGSSKAPSSAGRGEGPGDVQICFDFTKGVCSRGDSCRFSHDIATIVTVNSQERGICFDFVRGQCNRGLLCRFSHDLSNLAQHQQAGQLGAAAARLAPQPKTGAICYDYVKGACSRGQDCRYSHDINTIATNFRASPPPGTTEICHDFTRGRCTRGANCRYLHAPPAPSGAPAGWPSGGSGWVAAASPSTSSAAAAVLSAQQQQAPSMQNGVGFGTPPRPAEPHLQPRPSSAALPGSRYADVLGSRSQLSAPPPPPSRPSHAQATAVPTLTPQHGYVTQPRNAPGAAGASRASDPTAAHLGIPGYGNGVSLDRGNSMQQQANNLDSFGMGQAPGTSLNMAQASAAARSSMGDVQKHQRMLTNGDRLAHSGAAGGRMHGQPAPPVVPPGRNIPPHFQQSRPPPPPPRLQQQHSHPQQQPAPSHDVIGWQNDQVVPRPDSSNGLSQAPPLNDADLASAARMVLQPSPPAPPARQYLSPSSGLPAPGTQAVPTGWSTGHQLNNGMNQNTLGQLRQIWGRSS